MEQRIETGPIAKPERHISVQILCCGFAICNLRTHRGLKGQNRTGGSNPSPSATQSGLQRNCASSHPEIRQTCPYLAIFPRQTGLERTDWSGSNGVDVPAFLWRAQAQSGFEEDIRRMQCDHKLGMRSWRLDLCQHPTTEFGKNKTVRQQEGVYQYQSW